MGVNVHSIDCGICALISGYHILQMDFEEAGKEGSEARCEFEMLLLQDISSASGLAVHKFKVKKLEAGSIVATIEVCTDDSDEGLTAQRVVDDLEKQVSDTGSVLLSRNLTRHIQSFVIVAQMVDEKTSNPGESSGDKCVESLAAVPVRAFVKPLGFDDYGWRHASEFPVEEASLDSMDQGIVYWAQEFARRRSCSRLVTWWATLATPALVEHDHALDIRNRRFFRRQYLLAQRQVFRTWATYTQSKRPMSQMHNTSRTGLQNSRVIRGHVKHRDPQMRDQLLEMQSRHAMHTINTDFDIRFRHDVQYPQAQDCLMHHEQEQGIHPTAHDPRLGDGREAKSVESHRLEGVVQEVMSAALVGPQALRHKLSNLYSSGALNAGSLHLENKNHRVQSFIIVD